MAESTLARGCNNAPPESGYRSQGGLEEKGNGSTRGGSERVKRAKRRPRDGRTETGETVDNIGNGERS